MIKRFKKALGIQLVKSYKDNSGNYVINGNSVSSVGLVDNFRLFKSVREICKRKATETDIIFIRFSNIRLSAIHINLLSRGLKNFF